MKSNKKSPSQKWFQFSTRDLLGYFFIAAILCWVIAAMIRARNGVNESMCDNNIFKIRFALDKYRDINGDYPPLYIADANGKPMHSWRVLLLKYLDHDPEAAKIYALYNFNEPWNGPNNAKLIDKMTFFYQCYSESKRTTTPFLAVSSSTDKQKFNTAGEDPIQLVELHSKEVNWMEPVDISIEELNKLLTQGKFSKHSTHDGRIGVSTGQVRNKRIGNVPKDE